MIVTAALAWWNEPPELLEQCVRGMSIACDRLVAVDGGYARYPGATVRSAQEEYRAITETARDVGLEVKLVSRRSLWAGQVEKRARLLREAARGSDWVAVFDADWIATGDRSAVRDELEAQGSDVVRVMMDTPPGNSTDYASGWHRAHDDVSVELEHFVRALPALTCKQVHWHYLARKDGHRVTLRGAPGPDAPMSPSHLLRARYRLTHRVLQRSRQQMLASRAYLNDREMVERLTGQEDDRPDLPRPEWDYTTVPYE